MGEFKKFGEAVNKRYTELAKHELYQVDLLEIFESYLSTFPEGTNPIFRERTEHDCNCCKNFIRRLGSLVAIIDGEIKTVWEMDVQLPHPYDVVAERMDQLVKQAPIIGVFRSKERQYGAIQTPDTKEDILWKHFHGGVLAKHFTIKPEEAKGIIDAAIHVFRRGMQELKDEAFTTVIDLIEAKSIYRGEEHLKAVKDLKTLKDGYNAAPNKDVFILANYDKPASRARNSAIGTLLTDLSEGMELDKAVRMFEAKVAPTNYKRTTALITPKMVEDAVAKLRELGLEGAVKRRFARISDVSVNSVLFVDNSVRSQMKDGLTDMLMEATSAPKAKVDPSKALDMSIDDFIVKIVPQSTSIHALVETRHQGNFVSLTGGDGPERLFRWNNNFAWSYDGDVADSIKQRVKAAGGRVTGTKLRVSLAWHNADDLDLHCVDPRGVHIYYANKLDILDVDMNAGGRQNAIDPVENLSWLKKLEDGSYKIAVNQYSCRSPGANLGFTLEVESEGKLRQYRYDPRVSGTIDCLQITIKNEKITDIRVIDSRLVATSGEIDKWGIKTETLVPVDSLLLSPNHWDQPVGNKHWFFILKGCKNPDPARGIYNEFLRPDLEQHRKVLEVLGSKTKCPPTDDQLSGVGFTSGRGDTLTVVAKTGKGNLAFNLQF